MRLPSVRIIAVSSALCMVMGLSGLHAAAALSIANYPSIQDALDKNPGQMVEVPPGDYPITSSIQIHTDKSGLYGSGRIIQGNPQEAIITVKDATGVQINDLTLTRADGKMDAQNPAIKAVNTPQLSLQGLRILENRAPLTIDIDNAPRLRVLNCTIKNYMRISIDDRTKSNDWGFAFNVIDGTGINVRNCSSALIQGNTVTESEFVPTQELKDKYRLGMFCKKNAQKGVITTQQIWDTSYYNAWHQGSAICIATPETNDFIQILGNYIENAAQGVDIHGDHVIMSQNIINNAFIGMKAMHGSRNVIITNNQFSRNDLWSIGLMPGAASHATGVAAHATDDPTKAAANIDGESLIANNIISDFGYGTAAWMWKDVPRYPIKFEGGQKPFNPALANVVIHGNIVYDTGHDQIIENGKPVTEPPHYDYAVLVATGSGGPQGLHFSDNILNPGLKGVSNVELKP